jgi:hypothetical protein
MKMSKVRVLQVRVWPTFLPQRFLLGPRVSLSDTNLADDQPRKRRSRWGEASAKAELPGLPTAISSQGISQAQLDNYAIQLRLEEINRKLRLNDYIPPERERSVRRLPQLRLPLTHFR